MKVGLDISQSAHVGGVSTYIKRLSAGLVKKDNLDINFLYYSLRRPYTGDLPNVKQVKIPPSLAEILFNKFRFVSVENFLGNIDVFHSSDWIQPPTKAKKVTTYFDVIPLKYPHWSHPKIVEVHKRRLKIVEKEIDRVIAISNATKRDLLEITKIPEEKISVVYLGVDDYFKPCPKEAVEGFRQKYHLPQNFLLVLGGIGERKNLERIKQASQGFNLVITGETIPWVEDRERPLLYSAADVLLYPSLYEGFGLPILEAMACGLPVVTSEVSSIPEVAGDAALFTDPLSVEDIRAKTSMILSNQSLRDDLITKGFEQAKKFTWQKCVDETLKIYQQTIGS